MTKRVKQPFFPAALRAAFESERQRRNASAEWASAVQLVANSNSAFDMLPAALLMAKCASIELQAARGDQGSTTPTEYADPAQRAQQRRRLQRLTKGGCS